MNVLIVARTRMSRDRRCIGGLADDGRSVRLLTGAGHHWDTSAPFQVGQVWDVEFQPAQNVVPPHVEDVLASKYDFVREQPALRNHLLGRVAPWRGGIDQVFGGVLGYTSNDNGYVCARLGIPDQSTGFWLPDRDLTLRADDKHYDYRDGRLNRGLSYVGEPAPVSVLPAGTLVRVSLARWWKQEDAAPDFEERCYLQLSGWYA